MRNAVNLTLLTLLGLFSLGALADEWLPRLSCDASAFVVDGHHSKENGFTDHQVVLRNRDAIVFFQNYVGRPLPLNANGELVVQGIGTKFNGEFDVEMTQVPFHGPGEVIFHLVGHRLNNSSYEVDLTSFSCTPGNCGPPPGDFLGKWIFNNCQTSGN